MKLGKKVVAYKRKDREFRTFTIEKVEDHGKGNGVTLKFDNLYCLSVQRSRGFTPKVGMTLKVYGKGMGFPVRGIEVNKHIYKYLTPKQHEAEELEMEDKQRKKAIKGYKKNLKKLQKDYRSLPTVFQARIDKLRNQSPKDRYEWEPYEMFISTEAIKIINALKTVDEIEEYYKINKIRDLIPTLDKGHNTHTLEASVRLARKYLNGETI